VKIAISEVFPKLRADFPDLSQRINYPYVVPLASRTINMKAEMCPEIYLNPEMTYSGALTVLFSDYEIRVSNKVPLPFGEGILVYSDGSTYSG
jgi:hypothetical protein